MKKFKLFAFIGLLFASFLMFFTVNNAKAEEIISSNATINVDAEINQSKTILRFIVTSKGVKLNQIDEIELILKKDDVSSKKQLFITTVYTSISNASRDYVEEENTYYGILSITETKLLSGSKISANAKITYSDSSYKMMDNDKDFNFPTIPTYNQDDDYIYFGSYPQSKVTDETILDNLNNLAGTPSNPKEGYDWTSYDYFIKSVKSDYMQYIDIDLNNDSLNDYRGVYFSQYRPYAIDKDSSAGNSNQDGHGYKINTVYWFKYEPIKWDILNITDGKALITTNQAIDSQHYLFPNGQGGTAIGSHNGYDNRYLAAYDASDIRIWLNDDFYNMAFDNAEKKIINLTEVDNSIDTIGDVEKEILSNNSDISQAAFLGENTNDYVFLLSFDDYDSKYYEDSNSRKASATDYSKSQGFGNPDTATGDYWSRTPSTTLNGASYVTRSGNLINNDVNYNKAVTFVDGVRPTIIIDVDTFDFTVVNSNDSYGSVNISETSTRSYGEKIDLVATPNDTYSFDGWYIGEELISEDMEFTFKMPNESTTLEARFNYYTLSTSIDDQDAGEITSFDNEIISAGEELQISIDLNDGYSLDGWYIGDQLISDKEEFTYTMTKENVVIVAKTSRYTLSVDYYLANNFENAYEVTFETNCADKIDHQYSNNLVYPYLTRDGYMFAGWYDNPEFDGNTFDFNSNITSDIKLYARWIEKDGTSTYIPFGNNNKIAVPSNGPDFSDYCKIVAFIDGKLDFVSAYLYQYDYGTFEVYDSEMNVIYEPYKIYDTDWYVSKPIDAHAGDIFYVRFKPQRIWTQQGYKTHNAYMYFNQDTSTSGYKYGNTELYDSKAVKAGTKITLTANIIDRDTTFLGWFNGDELVSKYEIYTFTMPANDLNLYAKFEYYTVTLINDNEEAGTINDYNNKKFVAESTVGLLATTNEGYAFLGWYNGDELISTNLAYKFEMPYESLTYTAKFKEVSITLNKNIEEAGKLSVTKNIVYNEEAKITATINYGYTFIGWFDANDNLLTNETEYTFVVADLNSFVAKYFVNQISISKSLDESGEISDYEFGYLENQELELTFTINDGYTWYGWYLNDELLSTDKTITIILNRDVKSYVARTEKYVVNLNTNFEGAFKDFITITYESNGGDAVSPQLSNAVKYVQPTKSGYAFAGWYSDEELTTLYDFSSPLTKDITLYAKWIETDRPTFKLNERVRMSIPTDYLHTIDDCTFSFVALGTGTLTYSISDYPIDPRWGNYGFEMYILDSNKETLVYEDFHYDTTGESITCEVEEGKLYYFIARRHLVNPNDSRAYFELKLDIPTVKYITTSDKTIVVAGETVNITAQTNIGYTFVGWYLNDELITTNTNYTFTMPEGSVTYEARYVQNDVTYTVNHYLQNIDDNEYTLLDENIEIIDGLTGDNTTAEAKTLAGFNNLEFSQQIIKGDNSTIINIYYDRIIYNVSLNVSNETNDTIPGSVNFESDDFKYGKEVNIIVETKTGYTFKGLYKDNVLLTPNPEYSFTMPNNNLNIEARFESNVIEYDVIYWIENIYDNEYTNDKTITLSGYTGDLTEAELLTYDICVTPTITQLEIAGDGTTVINIYYKRKTVAEVGIEIEYNQFVNDLFGEIVTPDGFDDHYIYTSNGKYRRYSYKNYVKVGYEITLNASFEDGYSLEGWYLNDKTRFDNSDVADFKYVVSLDDVTTELKESNNAIWLVAKVISSYSVRYRYQDNLEAWLDLGFDRTYTIDYTLHHRDGVRLFTKSNETAETLTEIRDGFEPLEIKNIVVERNSAIIEVYCVPKQYILNIERVYAGQYVYYGDDYAGNPDTDIILYYGQASKLLKAVDTDEEGITYLGWYMEEDGNIVGEALTESLEYSFTMPSKNIMLVPVFSIKYELRSIKDGVTTVEERIGNIGFRVDVDEYEGYYVSSVRYYSREITDYGYSYLQDSSPIVIVEYKHISD